MIQSKALKTLIVMGCINTIIQSQPLYINEVMSKNDTTLADSDGDFTGWLEIYNGESLPVNLNGYTLSDNGDLPAKWSFGNVEILANNFLLVFASDKDRNDSSDNLHTNFKIKSAGESLLLSDPNGELIDSIYTGIIPPDISRGRKPDGSEEWYFFLESTPGGANFSEGLDSIVTLAPPIFSQGEGFYTEEVEVSISSSLEEATIYYTINGAEPDTGSKIYDNPLVFYETTVLRAKVIINGTSLRSKTTTKTFFVNDVDHSLPVFSISTDPTNLWGENGIYEDENIDWGEGETIIDVEIPINIEMFEKGGSLAFNYAAGAEIFGGGSTGFPQKSLAIYFRSRYDIGELDYKLFPDIPLMEFESFILRNSGNDWWSTLIRDALTVTLMKGNRNLDYQAYRPSVVYLNGEYWGIHNIREKLSEHFIEHHHFVTQEDLDMLEYKEVPTPQIIHGDLNNYNMMIDFLKNNDLSDNYNYDYITSQIDIDNFIDYQIMEIFCGNIDWPANNNKFWRSKSDEGKWRWIIYDTDTGYGLWDDWWQDGTPGYNVNHVKHATNDDDAYDNAWPNPAWSTYIFRNLLKNDSFKFKFLNRFSDLLNTRLTSENTFNEITKLHEKIAFSLSRHLVRWDMEQEEYYYELNKLKDFVRFRPDKVMLHLRDYFDLSYQVNVSVNIEPSQSGVIKLNSLFLSDDHWTGEYFPDIPITLVPIEKPGYKFSHWEGGDGSLDKVISISPTPNKSLSAIFIPDSSGSIVINEINYSSFDIADSGDWFEIYNSSSKSIQLDNWYVTDASSESFYFPENTRIESGGYLVVCKDTTQFKSVFGADISLIGNIGFGLSSDKDSLNLHDHNGLRIDEVFYRNNDPWPEKKNDSGQTIELVNSYLDNSLGRNWSLSQGYGTPGQINSRFNYINETSVTLIDTTGGSNIIVYPNPFVNSVFVRFYNEYAGLVEVKIFNILGQFITSLAKNQSPSGVYELIWNGSNKNGRVVSSGVYIAVLYIDSRKYDTVKMVRF